jgi:hypothetical protein
VGAVGPHRASGSRPAFTGRATAAFVVTSPDALVTKEVAAILLLADYTPAICAGAPCAMEFPSCSGHADVRANPSLHRKCYSRLRRLPNSGELKR